MFRLLVQNVVQNVIRNVVQNGCMAALLVGGAATLGGCAAGAEDETGSGGGGAGTPDIPFAGITITDVDLFQTIEVPLFDQGQVINTGRPVVAGKQALLRISYAVESGFAARNATVRIRFESASSPTEALSLTQQVIATSTPDVLDSALIVPIDGAAIATDTSIRVEILELDPKAKGDKSATNTFPATGFHPLGAQSVGNPTKVVFVPVAYQPDGTGRLPDTSPAQMEALSKRLLALYPTPSVDVSVGTTWNYNGPAVERNGDGWLELLSAFSDQHHGPGSSPTTYFYGLFNPAPDFSSYCQGGCQTGLSFVSEQASNADARSSVGLGFGEERSIETAMHEVGHAHGFNGHAPCGGAGSINPSFPHNDGSIGVFGLDVAELAYKSPTMFSDVMSYCDDNWTSDFTWSLWFERTKIVGHANADFHGQSQRWQSFMVRGDGSLVPLASHLRSRAPGQENATVRVRGAGGQLLEDTRGVFIGTDHLPGGMLFVPEVIGALTFELASLE